MNYEKWSLEYFEEAEKILRNMERLKEKLKKSKVDERQTIKQNIIRLRYLYYETLHTASYLKSRWEEMRTHAA